jgi:hypothetical protein
MMLAVLERPDDATLHEKVRAQVQSLCRRFPLYDGGPAGLAARTSVLLESGESCSAFEDTDFHR